MKTKYSVFGAGRINIFGYNNIKPPATLFLTKQQAEILKRLGFRVMPVVEQTVESKESKKEVKHVETKSTAKSEETKPTRRKRK